MKIDDTDFATFIVNEFPEGSEIGQQEIAVVLAKLGIADGDAALLAGAAARGWASSSDVLEFQPLGWRIQVSGKLAQSAMTAAILWGAMLACNVTMGIPVAIASALIPSLIDIERIKLTKREKTVLAHLTLKNKEEQATPEQWYTSLPAVVRAELSPLDFLDILEKIVDSGHGKNDGEEIRIFRSGDGRFAITFE